MRLPRHASLSLLLSVAAVCHAAVAPALAADPATDLLNPPVGPGPANDQSQINQILDTTVTSPGQLAPPSLVPSGIGGLPLPELPPELKDHNKNKTITLGPLHTGPLIQIAALNPVRMEASYTQSITLQEALVYALRNSLPIRINQQVFASQHYQFLGSIFAFLPSVGTNYSWTHSHVYPHTEIDSRVFQTNMSFPMFQGGRVMYGMLTQMYRTRAARNQLNTTINDVLLNTYNAYYNALLQRALLQIRTKSVEVSVAQLRLNEQLYMAGTGTRFAVMQSRTQLALDRQAMLQQQVALRLSCLELAYTINTPLAVNVIPMESTVSESSLLDERMGIEELMNAALVHRPELRQYESLRLSSARQVQAAAASLYPTAQYNITYQNSSTSVNGGGRGGRGGGGGGGGGGSNSLGALASAQNGGGGSFGGFSSNSPSVGVTTAGIPQISGTPLQIPQLTPGTGGLSVTPGSTNTTFGTQTAATTTGAGGSTVVTGGNGSLAAVGGVSSGTVSGSGGAGIGSFGGKFNSVSFNENNNWTLQNLGTTAAANILQARAGARTATLQMNQVLQGVSNQVRPSYLNMLAAREQIDVTATGAASAVEELRLANLRVQMGVGTNLELIQAQRDYIQALINQAQAIIASNRAQAQVLHDTGVISLETLTTGYRIR